MPPGDWGKLGEMDVGGTLVVVGGTARIHYTHHHSIAISHYCVQLCIQNSNEIHVYKIIQESNPILVL